MSFDVDPKALAVFAKTLETDRAAVASALTYLDAHSKVEEVGVIWQSAYEAHDQFAATLRQALAHLESIFKVSAGEMQKVITAYQHQDQMTAAKMDAVYPK